MAKSGCDGSVFMCIIVLVLAIFGNIIGGTVQLCRGVPDIVEHLSSIFCGLLVLAGVIRGSKTCFLTYLVLNIPSVFYILVSGHTRLTDIWFWAVLFVQYHMCLMYIYFDSDVNTRFSSWRTFSHSHRFLSLRAEQLKIYASSDRCTSLIIEKPTNCDKTELLLQTWPH